MKKKLMYVVAFVFMIILSMFFMEVMAKADMFIQDGEGNLLELHEVQPGVWSVVSSYRPINDGPGRQNVVADSVDTVLGHTRNRVDMIQTMPSITGTPT